MAEENQDLDPKKKISWKPSKANTSSDFDDVFDKVNVDDIDVSELTDKKTKNEKPKEKKKKVKKKTSTSDKATSKAKTTTAKKPNMNIKDAWHMIDGIGDLDAYIQKRKDTVPSWHERLGNPQYDFMSQQWIDIRELKNLYAIAPHIKGNHKLVRTKSSAPDDLREDDKWRTKWSEYIKNGSKIYDVYLDFKRHATLKNKEGDRFDVWLIDDTIDLDNQLNAIKAWMWWGKNFWQPLIINDIIVDPTEPTLEVSQEIKLEDIPSEEKSISGKKSQEKQKESIKETPEMPAVIKEEKNVKSVKAPLEEKKTQEKPIKKQAVKKVVPVKKSEPIPEIDIDSLTDISDEQISWTSETSSKTDKTEVPETIDINALTDISDDVWWETIPKSTPATPEKVPEKTISESVSEKVPSSQEEKAKKPAPKTKKVELQQEDSATLHADFFEENDDEFDDEDDEAPARKKRLIRLLWLLFLWVLLGLWWLIRKVMFSSAGENSNNTGNEEVVVIPAEDSDIEDKQGEKEWVDQDGYDDLIVLPDSNTWNVITGNDQWSDTLDDQEIVVSEEYLQELRSTIRVLKKDARTLLNKSRLINNASALRYAIAAFSQAEWLVKRLDENEAQVDVPELEETIDKVRLYIKSVRDLVD